MIFQQHIHTDLACLFSGLGIALGVTSLVAVIMTGVTTVLCCKLRSQSSTDADKLVSLY